MLPDDATVAVIVVTWMGFITSHLSLYFSYKWGQIDIRLSFENLGRSGVKLIVFIAYVLLHSVVLSLMVVGVQHPDMLADIILTCIYWSAGTTLPFSICSGPVVMDTKATSN